MATVCTTDGTRALSARGDAAATREEASALGTRLAQELLERGAAELIGELRGVQAVEEP
jgi:porphobilinogen deaminase